MAYFCNADSGSTIGPSAPVYSLLQQCNIVERIKMPKGPDLAVRWNDSKSSVLRLKRTGRVAIHCRPLKLLCPGGLVAIVSKNNYIQLTFKAKSINGPRRVTLANGNSCPNGYIIRGDKRTMKQPKPVKAPFRGWYAIGALRYFDAKTMRAIVVGNNFGSSDPYIDESTKSSGVVFQPHYQGIPGLPKKHPESTLVDRYVSWLGVDTRFGHNYLRDAKLFVDLFDLTHWQLIEAKVAISREVIRMAIGQLRDYKRYYPRRYPSLAVLLASRPSANCIKLLTDNRIAAIWRNPKGSFSTRRWQERSK